jgi:cytochrome c oxidase accessory protein FixG
MSDQNIPESFRDRISTVDEKGKRKWVYPKKPKGRFYNYRSIVAYLLLAILVIIPFIKIKGNQFLLFDIFERKFIIFGVVFTPQDMHLFAIGTVALMFFIILFTFVFGRLFCGWVCPQTVFMEMVYRRIEYLIEGDARSQIKLNKAPWTPKKIFKKTLKHLIFAVIAVLAINLLMSYIVSSDRLLEMIISPVTSNWGFFVAMAVLSFMFYFIFAFFREQVCTTVCPYGRMQGVLLVDDSIVVQYDFARGENRGTAKQRKLNSKPTLSLVEQMEAEVREAKIARELPVDEWGDCIDCNQCVDICPTGIDIRNGTQLECVNCTACMDACDDVMVKTGKPRGLIRYDSYNGVMAGRDKLITKRGWGYVAVLVAILTAFTIIFINRSPVEAIILRTPGLTYLNTGEEQISNLYNYKLINKTTEDMENLTLKLVNVDGVVEYVGGQIPTIPKLGRSEGSFFVKIDKSKIQGQKLKLEFELYSDGKLIDEANSNFLGPINN